MTSTPQRSAPHQGRLLWDMVLPYELELGNDASILKQWQDAGFSFVSMHPAGDRHTIGEAMRRLAAVRAAIREREDLVLALTTKDVLDARAAGKLAVGLHVEGSRLLERDVDMVQLYHDVGVRFCHPVFNQNNSFGGGCAEPEDTGMTTFGRRVVAEMNRVGILLDGSHVSRRTTLEMIEASTAPVIFSHNAIYGVNPHFRNVSDEQIRACAASGGVIGITGMNSYLGAEPTNETLLRHIEYVIDLVGWQHVGLGLDYVHDVDALHRFVGGRPDEWNGTGAHRFSFASPAQVPSLVEAMEARGYEEKAIDGIVGENFLRVCSEVWDD